jgi:hypothetical protein
MISSMKKDSYTYTNRSVVFHGYSGFLPSKNNHHDVTETRALHETPIILLIKKVDK